MANSPFKNLYLDADTKCIGLETQKLRKGFVLNEGDGGLIFPFLIPRFFVLFIVGRWKFSSPVNLEEYFSRHDAYGLPHNNPGFTSGVGILPGV